LLKFAKAIVKTCVGNNFLVHRLGMFILLWLIVTVYDAEPELR